MKNISILLAICLLPFLAMAQTFPSETTTLAAPTTVNVAELAQYELANPRVLIARDFEEDEDAKDAIPHNRPVTAEDLANTVKFHFDFESQRAASPAPIANFNALDDNGASIPPDIHAAAGPNHLMVTLNTQYRIQSKTGTTISTVTADGFWAGTGGTNPSTFDPKILYDSYSNRWILVSCANAAASNSALLVAVSQTNDPTGVWNRFLIDADAANTSWFDYPSLGLNKDWIVVTGNMFPNTGSGYNGGKVWVLNKANAYAGTTTGLTTINSGTTTFTLCPAVTYDNTLATVYLVQEYNPNSGGNAFLQLYSLTGATPTLTATGTFSTNLPYSDAGVAGAPQSGSTNKIATNDSRIQNVVYRNGSIYVAHAVYLPTTTPTRTSVQWWQVDPATRVVQQAGRVDDATGVFHYGFPSIMPNSAGDVAIGFSRFSSTTFASAGYALRYAADAVNTLNTPYIYKAGTTSYYKTFGGTDNRWGDYTATALDPDGSTFWLVQEYASATTNNWGTWWAKVTGTASTSCGTPTGLASASITSSGATVSWTAVSGATSYNLQYKTAAATTWTTVSSTTTSSTLTGLVANTTYNFQVQAVCSATSSSTYSTASSFTTAAAPCSTAPVGLASASITSTGATLSWTAATGATSYNIQYKTSAATTWTTTTSTTNSKALTGLVANTTYNFQVQAVCSATSSSPYSTAASFTTLVAPCSAAPTGLSATAITSTGVTLNWAAASGATSYNVQYKTSAATTWTTTTSTTTSKALTGLVASTVYNFQVQAVCSATSTSAYSTASTFTTLAAGCTDVGEANNTLATASAIALNTNLTAQIASATDLDYYSFTTTTAQNLVVTLTTLPADYDMRLFNAAGTQVGSSQNAGTTGETMNYANAPAGTYKIYVYGYGGVFSNTACYTLKVTTSTASGCTNSNEPNETFATALAITPNIDIKGQIASATDLDYLKFTTTAATNITADLTTLPADYDLAIYNSAGTLLASSQNASTTAETVTLTSAAAGTYTVYILGYGGVFSTTSCYNLKVTVANGSFAPVKGGDSDIAAELATEIKLVPNPATENVTVFFTHNADEVVRLTIFDQTGRDVRKYNVGLMNTENKFDLDLTDLSAGLYTVQMQGANWMKVQKLVIANK